LNNELIIASLTVFIIAFGIPALLHLTRHLGPQSRNRAKDLEYESGVTSTLGDSTTRFSIKFYLVAILFVLFDVEIVFLFPWAVNVRELGTLGIAEMFSFVGLLFAGLIYIYNKRALKWD
jgi:NADH-quinone oxidoreductase subunit A